MNGCVLTVLQKYLNTMHAVCYHEANAWRQVFCTSSNVQTRVSASLGSMLRNKVCCHSDYPATGGNSLFRNVGNCLQHQTSRCNDLEDRNVHFHRR